jgi:hypothetical protein
MTRISCGLGSFAYLHGLNEPSTDAVDVLHHSVSQKLSIHITNDLMHLNNDCACWIKMKSLRLNARIDLGPLPQPILADCFVSVNSAAFHAVGPVNIWMHICQHRIHIPTVESLICLGKQILNTLVHKSHLNTKLLSVIFRAVSISSPAKLTSRTAVRHNIDSNERSVSS